MNDTDRPTTSAGIRLNDPDMLLRQLYSEHGRAILAYAARLLGGDTALAEDVLQETLVRAWRSRVVLDDDRPARPWLLTVTHNVVVDWLRTRARRPQEIGVGAMPDEESSADELAASDLGQKPTDHPVGLATKIDRPRERDISEEVANRLVIQGALQRLEPHHREILQQVYVYGRSLAQAAEALGIPVGTAKSRTHYALRELRALLLTDEGPT